MTERLADIGARITGVRQLGAVVNAMRGLAAARAQQARNQLVAVDAYALTIATAIGRVAPLVSPLASTATNRKSGPGALVLFCAEQGFAGAFSKRVLIAAGPSLATARLFLLGARGLSAAAERGIHPSWDMPMPTHSSGIPKLASAVAEALGPYLATGEHPTVDIVFTDWRPGRGAVVVQRRLLPFDPPPGPGTPDRNPPLLNMPPPTLMAALTTESFHAQLCSAALHAFAAENEARVEAMAAARTQIERQLAALQATERMVRQEEITAEIIELAAGETASRSKRSTWSDAITSS